VACVRDFGTQELNRGEEVVALVQRERDECLELEHSKDAREIEKQLQKVQADIVENGVQVQEALTEGLVREQKFGDQPLRRVVKYLPDFLSDLPVTTIYLRQAVLG